MATIKVLSAGAVQSMVSAIGAEFERLSGHWLDLNFGTAGSLRARVHAGEPADLIILPEAVIATLEKKGMLLPGSAKDLGRTVTGVAVREGAPVPDISTPEAFRRALLAAESVAFNDPNAGGTSGIFFADVLQRLGVADEVARKAVVVKRGHEVAQALADGQAEIGSTFISEILPVPGVKVVGPLPAGLDNANTYTAAIPRDSAQPEAARALLRALTEPASRSRWIAAGLEPAFV